MSSYSIKLNDVPSSITGSDRIKVWQRYLNSIGMLSSASGKFDEATKAATEVYGREIYKSGDDVFVMSFGRPDREHYSTADSGVILTSEIKEPLAKIAYGYFILTAQELKITSGLRTPEKQAQLMYEKARWGQLGIYKNHRLAGEVRTAYEKARNTHAGEQNEVDAITATIREQVSHGEYISSHLTGRAFDVRNASITGCHKTCFEALIKLVFGTTQGHLIENEGPGSEKHFHVQF